MLTSLTDRLKASVKKLTSPHTLSPELSLRNFHMIVIEAPASSISKGHPGKICCSLPYIKSRLKFEGFVGGGISHLESPNTQLEIFGKLLTISSFDLPPNVEIVFR